MFGLGNGKEKLPNYERRQFLTILIVLYFMARTVSVCPVPGARLLRVCHRLLHVRDLPGALPLCLQGTEH